MNTQSNSKAGSGCSSHALFGFGSLQIIESSNLIVQFRKPVSKKRRIRKKWAKQKENWRPDRHAYRMGNQVLVHPTMAAAIRRESSEPNAKHTHGANNH